MNIGKIVKQAKKNRALDKKEEELMVKAFEFARHAHQGQKRKTGEAFIGHTLRVASTLAQFGVDSVTIAAGLLHDVMVDAQVTKKELIQNFSKEIANLVEGVTNVKGVIYDDTDYQKTNLNRALKAISGDVRVAIIRLVDRWDNMKSLEVHPQEKMQRIAQETLDIYSPIAERLGLGVIKGDLEDLSFYYLFPETFAKLKKQADAEMQNKKAKLSKLKEQIKKILSKEKIKVVEMDLRSKHYYSLYQKLERYDDSLNQLQDLVVIRVIVPTVNSCYQALRAIHKNFKFMPGRIKDYIALPKANGYQSLHTVIFDKLGGLTEIQIKTEEMHNRAGLGAVLDLDEIGLRGGKGRMENTNTQWLKHLKRWQSESSDLPPNDFYDILKNDFLKNRIVVFDQRGNVYDLPEGSTLIDFSFVTQGQRGLHTYKGKVNNETKSLCHVLKNGDIIEVGFDKKNILKRDLIKCAKTNIARKYLARLK